MSENTNEYGLYFWLHLAVIILIWLSWLIFPWWFVLAAVGVYYLQLLVIGDCILTRGQFHTVKRTKTFYHHYLVKVFPKLSQSKVRFVADYIMPWVIVGFALIWQLYFNKISYVQTF